MTKPEGSVCVINVAICFFMLCPGCRFSINPLRRRHRWLSPTLAAAVSGEELSVSDSSSINDESGRNGEENGGVEGLDDNKMVRVCDKLIDVFLVDKPTPTDWRRLLAFSKEWDNIRPHFYKRCQVRADSEDADPGMKHKLLRLARKLKEVYH